MRGHEDGLVRHDDDDDDDDGVPFGDQLNSKKKKRCKRCRGRQGLLSTASAIYGT